MSEALTPRTVVTYSPVFARVYDALFAEPASQRRNAAIQVFLARVFAEEARREVRDVLDLTAGTGAQAIPLARRGLRVTAQDASPAMLERLRARLAAEADPLAVDVVERAMQDLEAEAAYDAAICCFTAFNHVLSTEEQRAVAAAVFRALRPGGVFVVDVGHFPALLGRFQRESVAVFEADGLVVEQRVERRVDAAKNRFHHRQLTKVFHPDGRVEVQLEELPLRLVSQGELELLLEGAGFAQRCQADYTGDGDGFRLVFVAVKPRETPSS